MPQRPSRTTYAYRATLNTTPATGAVLSPTQTTAATANSPVPIPPLLIGIDAVPLTGNNSNTVSFKALVKRSTQVNPLQSTNATNETITVRTGDTMVFTAYPQGYNTATVSCACYAITQNGTQVPGPFLGPETYVNFQVVIDNPQNVQGYVVGQLYYQLGAQ